MEIARIKGQELGLLSLVMQDEEGRSALLQGMIHLATEEFYKRVQEAIDEDPEALVLAEGRNVRGNKDLNAFLGEFGLALQAVCIKNPTERTIQESKTGEEIKEKLLAASMLIRVLKRIDDYQNRSLELDPKQVKKDLPKILEYFRVTLEPFLKPVGVNFRMLMSMFPFQKIIEKFPRVVYRILITERNHELVQRMNSTEPGTRIMVPWGAAHLPDLVEQLEGTGWHMVPDSEEYVTCMIVPTNEELNESAWDFFAAAVKFVFPQIHKSIVRAFSLS